MRSTELHFGLKQNQTKPNKKRNKGAFRTGCKVNSTNMYNIICMERDTEILYANGDIGWLCIYAKKNRSNPVFVDVCPFCICQWSDCIFFVCLSVCLSICLNRTKCMHERIETKQNCRHTLLCVCVLPHTKLNEIWCQDFVFYDVRKPFVEAEQVWKDISSKCNKMAGFDHCLAVIRPTRNHTILQLWTLRFKCFIPISIRSLFFDW